MAKIDREELRALVRQALKEALGGTAPAVPPPAASAPASKAVPPASDLASRVRIAAGAKDAPAIPVAAGSGQELTHFARAIAEACSDAAIRAALVAGKVRFAPSAGTSSTAPTNAPAPAQAAKAAGAYEMASGVLSEAKLVEIARSHGRINLGANVVLTPLARDKAREMRIELTRQRP